MIIVSHFTDKAAVQIAYPMAFPLFLTVRKQDWFGCSLFHIQESWPPLLSQGINPD